MVDYELVLFDHRHSLSDDLLDQYILMDRALSIKMFEVSGIKVPERLLKTEVSKQDRDEEKKLVKTNKELFSLLAVDGDKLIGLICIWDSDKSYVNYLLNESAHIDSLYVSEEYRHQGIASRLFYEGIKRVKNNPLLHWSTPFANTGARQLYEKHLGAIIEGYRLINKPEKHKLIVNPEIVLERVTNMDEAFEHCWHNVNATAKAILPRPNLERYRNAFKNLGETQAVWKHNHDYIVTENAPVYKTQWAYIDTFCTPENDSLERRLELAAAVVAELGKSTPINGGVVLGSASTPAVSLKEMERKIKLPWEIRSVNYVYKLR